MPRDRKQQRREETDLQERVVYIHRVSKTVKGGRRMFTEHGSIPHDVEGHYGAGRVLIKPAIEGTGVIAGGPVRPLFELAGITNVLSKSLGTNNALNIIKAAADGLQQLSSPAEAAERRGITVKEMFAGKEA